MYRLSFPGSYYTSIVEHFIEAYTFILSIHPLIYQVMGPAKEFVSSTPKDDAVPRLESDRTNWVIFKIHLTMSVAAHSTCGHLDGTDVCPTALRLSTSVVADWTEDDKKVYTGYQIQLGKWTHAEDIARACLTSVIPDSILMWVHTSDTVTIMWKAISNEFEDKSHMVSVDLHKTMMQLRAKEGDDLCAHLNKLHHMNKQWVGMNAALSKEDYVATILGSLPSVYTQHLFSLTATASSITRP